ncbi:MAG: hypothetical protein Ct9H300mP25_02630 [Acidobacteriota bacterium]|nr:MAG: hypothetical protein Ct9H300mP25_02630 [Acidobacteriota bacterium]
MKIVNPVVEKHAAGRAINPNNVVRDTGTEFHPGAIRFYREIGIWETQKALVSPQPLALKQFSSKRPANSQPYD